MGSMIGPTSKRFTHINEMTYIKPFMQCLEHNAHKCWQYAEAKRIPCREMQDWSRGHPTSYSLLSRHSEDASTGVLVTLYYNWLFTAAFPVSLWASSRLKSCFIDLCASTSWQFLIYVSIQDMFFEWRYFRCSGIYSFFQDALKFICFSRSIEFLKESWIFKNPRRIFLNSKDFLLLIHFYLYSVTGNRSVRLTFFGS